MENKLIQYKYIIKHQIGQGSFGTIYQAQNIRTNELVAIKVEPIEHKYKLLKNESIIYHFLHHTKGIPELKWFGKDDINYYMVITLLGKSLENWKCEKGRIPMDEICWVTIEMLHILKSIHEKGLIHRDIKPENFLFSFSLEEEKKDDVYLIDFGFCKTYFNSKTKKHNEQKKTSNLIGTTTFLSIHGHNFLELSRRDDLESLGYMMIYFYFGQLKWNHVDVTEDTEYRNQLIKRAKENIHQLYELPTKIMNYMNYVKQLQYEEEPNYNYLIDILSHD